MEDSENEIGTVREENKRKRTARIADYVSDCLREHFSCPAELDRFIARFPCYESCRDSLLRECRLSCMACAMTAVRITCRDEELVDELFDSLKEKSARSADKKKHIKDKPLPLTDDDAAKIAAYSRVHRHISLKSRNRESSEGATLDSYIKSIGYMTVKSVLAANSAGLDEFGATVHLLHEFVAPLLRSALEEYMASLKKTTWNRACK